MAAGFLVENLPWWIFIWIISWQFWSKIVLQIKHLLFWTPWWRTTCCFKLLLCVNDVEQSVQLNGFSPVWDSKCLFREPKYENCLLHTEQGKVYSPVCVRMCSARYLRGCNLLQCGHEWSFLLADGLVFVFWLSVFSFCSLCSPSWQVIELCLELAAGFLAGWQPASLILAQVFMAEIFLASLLDCF